MTLKQSIHLAFLNLLGQKIFALQKNLAELANSAANETKSTAGDKHETALAMLQIEQANTRKQLENAVVQLEVLEKIQAENTSAIIRLGSVVYTDKANFYISAAIGKTSIEGQVYLSISAAAPIAKHLIGKSINEIIEINGQNYFILNVL
jgi:transcription elongation GreA/GreB family factor